MSPHRGSKIESPEFCSKILALIEQFRSSGISIQDFENLNSSLEIISKIFGQLDLPLPLLWKNLSRHDLHSNSLDLQDSEKGENGKEKTESWLAQLRRLRRTSISVLSGRPIEEIDSKESETRKRKLKKGVNESANKRIRNEEEVEGHKLGLLPHCYICKGHTPAIVGSRHSYYPWMCPPCGDLNYLKRTQSGDLGGKLAVVTGGRIKIGFEIVLKLLRAGATVVTTTRFPDDALGRFQKELDFPTFASRLHFYGLDLRFLGQVEEFCEHFVEKFGKLDVLVVNAAQTIRKPTVYYKTLVAGEQQNAFNNNNFLSGIEMADMEGNTNSVCKNPLGSQSPALPLTTLLRPEKQENGVSLPNSHSSQLLVHPDDYKYANEPILSQKHFPSGEKDSDGNQLDLRSSNSWILELGQVETSEMVEVTLVNYMSPYVLLQKLTPLMKRQRTGRTELGFIVLVSAMEGKFENCLKSGKHPHTNGAKAGLNMLVRTCGRSYYKELGVVMNAVDTGWVTEEHPIGFQSDNQPNPNYPTPLDSIDGAARVLDPIFTAINDKGQVPTYGKFLKDYQPTDW